MSGSIEQTATWAYHGLWGLLARWMKVPREPPSLPAAAGDKVTTLRPSPEWLGYLKFTFWISIGIFNIAATAVLFAVMVAAPLIGMLLTLPWALVVGLPNLVGYVALYLRYDSTWYLLSSRSMRIRRGIWIISETTITYENIQNVTVMQGPLERWFGIANVVVQTAGGGGHAGPSGQGGAATHVGLLEGLTDAATIRELILNRVRKSTQAGLGDEAHEAQSTSPPWRASAAHVQTLRQIRDILVGLTRAN